MKILHTSDWHIGKIVNEFSMIDEQKYILDKFIQIVEKENIDVILIAGDIYDRSIPPVEGVELLNKTLNTLVNEKKVKVLISSGNHDSGERLSFGSELLKNNGLYICGDKLFEHIKIDSVNFYLIPYKDPSVVRQILDNKEIKNHNDAMKETISKIKENFNKDEKNIVVAHGYVTKKSLDNKENNLDEKNTVLENSSIDEKSSKNKEKLNRYDEFDLSDSERPLSIGGTDLIDSNLFDDFDYVALGHLHGRQKVGKESIRYSGSLLKYSFSEVNHNKGVVIFDTDNFEFNFESLIPKRNLRIIKGNIDEIIEKGRLDENNKDYIKVVLTDEYEILNPLEKIRSVYPNTMILLKESKNFKKEFIANNSQNKKSELELFKEFYEEFSDNPYTEEKEEVIKNIIDEILREGCSVIC